jgi:hypothetical protein
MATVATTRRRGRATITTRTALLKLTVVALTGCVAHFHGGLRVDGEPFDPVSCSSGRWDAQRVDLEDRSGRRIRLNIHQRGAVHVVYFAPGSPPDVGYVLGANCAELTLRKQASAVGGVPNIAGSAQIDCLGNGHRVEGVVRFENCH